MRVRIPVARLAARRSRLTLGLLALLAAVALATPLQALACVPEVPTIAIADLRQSAALVVDGHVTSVGADLSITIRVDSVLQGTAGSTVTVHDDDATCPFTPQVGDRVVVAASADDVILAAWLITDDGSAYGWYQTRPALETAAAVLAAFGAPDTSTAVAAPTVLRTEGVPAIVPWLVLPAAFAVASVLIGRRQRR